MKPYKSDLRVLDSVLLVSAHKHDHRQLHGILDPTDWRLHTAESYTQALAVLRRDRPALLLCEAALPDGSWRDLLSQIAAIPDAPLLVVMSESADDRLWSEVLNLGGYDVLSKPLDESEVLRTLSLARKPAGAVAAAAR